MRRLRRWLAETHSSSFELRRHFFSRFFDSEFISSPGQAKVVAGGALAILISFSLLFTQAYYHKYRMLASLDDRQPFLHAELADVLFIITLAMLAMGLFTTLQWPALFPGLRDYLVLASLPVRMRDVFVAKFTALAGFATLATVATTALPSIVLPAVMSDGWDPHPVRQLPAIFLSASLACLFVFFCMVAAQGVLLNVVPVRHFPRVVINSRFVAHSACMCRAFLVHDSESGSANEPATRLGNVGASPLVPGVGSGDHREYGAFGDRSGAAEHKWNYQRRRGRYLHIHMELPAAPGAAAGVAYAGEQHTHDIPARSSRPVATRSLYARCLWLYMEESGPEPSPSLDPDGFLRGRARRDLARNCGGDRA